MVTHADITKKFKMASVKLEIHVSTFVHGVSKLLYMITTKIQRLYHDFWVRQHGETKWEYCPMGMS